MEETESTSFFLVITLSSIVFFSFGLRLMIEQVMTWLAAVSSLIGDRDSQPGLTSGYKRFPLPLIWPARVSFSPPARSKEEEILLMERPALSLPLDGWTGS